MADGLDLGNAFGLSPDGDGGDGNALQIENLTVEFNTELGRVVAVDNVTFRLERGSTLGLVGESGSGKTVTSLALLGLVGAGGRISSGRVLLEGRDLLRLPPRELSRVRGKEIAMIFQEPRRSLDPTFPVGVQIAEVARRHLGLSRKASWRRAVEMLDLVHIPNAAQRAREYPHAFSGGMCQRVMLAMALVAKPKVLIADEPTTALDVTVQARVLELLRELQREMNLGIVFITHDLGIVAEMCHGVAVMYAGQIVEKAPVSALFHKTQHPYTQTLLDSLPQAVAHRQGYRFTSTGAPPRPYALPEGCRFHPRCPHMQQKCTETDPELVDCGPQHLTRCIRFDEISLRGVA